MAIRENHAGSAGAARGKSMSGDVFFAGVYRELHGLARRCLAREHGPCTLSPATLVHEAYLRLSADAALAAGDRRRFFALAGIAMRRILIDHARARRAGKRIPAEFLCTYHDDENPAQEQVLAAEQLLSLDRALEHLAQIDPQMVAVVELRYFAGLSVDETAAALELSPRTVNRQWTAARAWLARELA